MGVQICFQITPPTWLYGSVCTYISIFYCQRETAIHSFGTPLSVQSILTSP